MAQPFQALRYPAYDGFSGDDPAHQGDRVCRTIIMATPSTILVYGRDPLLLETRSWVLEEAGYRVDTASDLKDAEQKLSASSVSLMLLCHTLTSKERSDVLAAANRLNPSAKRLLLTASTIIPIDAPHEPVLSALDGPRALIAAVKRVLPSS